MRAARRLDSNRMPAVALRKTRARECSSRGTMRSASSTSGIMDEPASSGLPSKDEMPGFTFMLPPASARMSGSPSIVPALGSQEKTCTRVPVEPPSNTTAYDRPPGAVVGSARTHAASNARDPVRINQPVSVIPAVTKQLSKQNRGRYHVVESRTWYRMRPVPRTARTGASGSDFATACTFCAHGSEFSTTSTICEYVEAGAIPCA